MPLPAETRGCDGGDVVLQHAGGSESKAHNESPYFSVVFVGFLVYGFVIYGSLELLAEPSNRI